jgi:hypothetical protein
MQPVNGFGISADFRVPGLQVIGHYLKVPTVAV